MAVEPVERIGWQCILAYECKAFLEHHHDRVHMNELRRDRHDESLPVLLAQPARDLFGAGLG